MCKRSRNRSLERVGGNENALKEMYEKNIKIVIAQFKIKIAQLGI